MTAGRWRLVLLAFVFHYPGLRLLAGLRLDRRIARWNLMAVLATLTAMGCAAATAERPLIATVGAWLIGHFAWSLFLSMHVARAAAPGRQ